ncbi:glycine cleavage system protein H [bacterium]|nr:glycine cleavage system protein H [bacterium]
MKFTKTHEWIAKVGDVYRVGISDYAQSHMNDIVYAESEADGSEVKKGERLGTLESVKAAEDFFAPIDIKVIAFNDILADAPETVNKAAETDGWIVEVEVMNEGQLDELMDESQYKEFLSTLE